MKFFLLNRLFGIVQVLDGLLHFFTSKRSHLPLKVAKRISKERMLVLDRQSEFLHNLPQPNLFKE